MRRELIIPAVCGVLLLLTRILPAPQNGVLAGLPTICPFKILSALPCPGCGMTRSIVLSAHGQWEQAFDFHPLGPILYFAIWCAFVSGVLLARRINTKEARVFTGRIAMPLAATFCVLMLGIWALRISGALPFPVNF